MSFHTIENHNFKIYPTEEHAQKNAEIYQANDFDGWTYKVESMPRGFVISAYDEDGHFVAKMN